MNIAKSYHKNGSLECLFYSKLKLYSNGWDNKIPLKVCNQKFSLLFLTKDQTLQILKILESKGYVKLNKKEVIIT